MSAAAILGRLHDEGVRVRAAGEQVFLAPRAKVTPDVLALVRANKAALLEELERSAAVAAAALNRRRVKVERELQANPSLHVAWDVANAPPRPEPGPPVSVVIACRTGVGIVSGELHVPREKWDPVFFLRALEETGKPS